jgi:hypothetical protein
VLVTLALSVAVRGISAVRDRDLSTGPPPYWHAFYDPAVGSSRVTFSVSYDPMSYGLLKRVALDAFARSPLLGVGLGQFHEATERAYRAGRLHKTYRAADPHCALLGRLAETGLLGGLSLAALWLGFLARTAPSACRADPSGWAARTLLAGCIGLLVNSLNADVMHFRFLWVALGLLRGLPRANQAHHS